MLSSGARLEKFRRALVGVGLDAYLIPSGDAHQSEYIAAADARRGFLSGFTGSAGYAVVTVGKAALWTDGRYFIQAERQLGPEWTLMRDGLPETPKRIEWLSKELKEGSKVGYDPKLITISEFQNMKTQLGSRIALVPTSENLVDKIWENKPERPANPLIVLELKYSGHSHVEKIGNIQKYLKEYSGGARGFFVSGLDEICWALNLRGSDIPFNPVFFAYLLITANESFLFTDSHRLDATVKKHLQESNTSVLPYESAFEYIKKSQSSGEKRKLLVSEIASMAVLDAVGNDESSIEVIKSPIVKAKAIKNETELDGFRNCHLRDAVALCRFFGWLENELTVNGNTKLSEVDAADKLESFRKQLKDFMGLSFDTISSTGPNGAIIHYKPEKETCAIIKKDAVYLCDSGGQYKDGTTDVTRTYHFGQANEFEKLCFTRVLQGHIALDSVIFPEGTTGYLLDPFARSPLWKSGLNYLHGTGHGVGSFLNVHEGPHGIGIRKPYDEVPLVPGMTVTNEPGYYHKDAFGIRIENILIVKEARTPYNFNGKKYYGFECVTYVPLGRNLIDKSLLSAEEIQWIDNYHLECRSKLSKLIPSDDKLALNWLIKETERL